MPAVIESLEPRLLLATISGYMWSNTNVSVSYLPEGADTEGYANVLFSMLDAVAPTDVWQREFALALQTWANVSTLNFHFVNDSGAPIGTSGSPQGDSRFGDIRLSAHPLGTPLAYAYYPGNWGTKSGDIMLNPDYTFKIGSRFDLRAVLLHEIGHSLGLGHSTSGTVMYGTYTGLVALTSDDIEGIQTIYGARQHDIYDAAAPNDSHSTATAMPGSGTYYADLTTMADVDYYRFTAPLDSDGTLTVSVDARGLSLLAPAVMVYDAAGIGSASASSPYGSVATVSLSGLTPGETYYVRVDGATSDAFGMGAYVLDVRFGVTGSGGGSEGGGSDGGDTESGAVTIAPDRFEPNDSFAAATNLGKFNNRSETGLTLHTALDLDYYRFQVSKSDTFRISATTASSSEVVLVAVYDAGGNVLASGSGPLTVSLSSGVDYFVRVSSGDGLTHEYSLDIAKTGGGGVKGNGKAMGGNLGHAYYPEGFEGEHDHDHDEHGHGHGGGPGRGHGARGQAVAAAARALAAGSEHGLSVAAVAVGSRESGKRPAAADGRAAVSAAVVPPARLLTSGSGRRGASDGAGESAGPLSDRELPEVALDAVFARFHVLAADGLDGAPGAGSLLA